MSNLTITDLEEAIRRCGCAEPVIDHVLPPGMRVMADIYGRMIYEHREHIPMHSLPDAVLRELAKWLPVQDGKYSKAEALACPLAPDGHADSCEVCQ